MKRLKKQVKGITLVALVVTIIVLLILATVAIGLTVGKNGIFSRAEIAGNEHIKQEATEAMNLKITGIQIQSYTENQTLPDLQYLADKLCEDDEMEYVKKGETKLASLKKIDVADVNSIFTKIKKYSYVFEIDSNLKLASIDGVKLAESDNTVNNDLIDRLDNIELAIEELQEENKLLKSQLKATQDKNDSLENMINNQEYTFEKLASTVSLTDQTVSVNGGLDSYKYIMVIRSYESGSSMCSGWIPVDVFEELGKLITRYSRKFRKLCL